MIVQNVPANRAKCTTARAGFGERSVSKCFRSSQFRKADNPGIRSALSGGAEVSPPDTPMTRLAALLLLSFCAPTSASARTLDPKPPARPPLTLALRAPAAPAAAGDELTLTRRTEVILDGRPCAYKDVPAGASVVRVEVAEDRRTVL